MFYKAPNRNIYFAQRYWTENLTDYKNDYLKLKYLHKILRIIFQFYLKNNCLFNPVKKNCVTDVKILSILERTFSSVDYNMVLHSYQTFNNNFLSVLIIKLRQWNVPEPLRLCNIDDNGGNHLSNFSSCV